MRASLLLTIAQWPSDDGLTMSQAQNLYLGGIAICALVVLFALRQFRTVASRAVVVVLMVGLAGFFYWQREEVQDCAGQCSCELLGRELAIHDENAFCPDN